MATSITQLAELISTSVAGLTKTCSQNGIRIPSLNDQASPEADAQLRDERVSENIKIIVSAAMQLAASVSPAEASMVTMGTSYMKPAAINTAIRANVAEILREAGPAGMTIEDIANVSGVDSNKLGRILRFLASNNVFREVKPNVFANNRLSGSLDTGKSVKDVMTSPLNKHVGAKGFPAMMEAITGVGLRASSYIAENTVDPKTTHSDEPNLAPLQRSASTDKPVMQWLQEPAQRDLLSCITSAIPSVTSVWWPPVSFENFDWKKLAADSIVVDVGSIMRPFYGIELAKEHPNLRFVVQESSAQIEGLQKIWKSQSPQSLSSGRVEFQVNTVFDPQPVRNASVFLLNNYLSYWPDAYCSKILGNLRQAATKNTVLLMTATVIQYACRDSDVEKKMAGSSSAISNAAARLLPTYDPTRDNDTAYMLDLILLTFTNSQERTLPQLKEMLEKSGWRISRIDPCHSTLDAIQAIPI